MLFQKKYNWTPRHIGVFASIAFFVLLIFYSSEFKIKFLDWGFGGAIWILTVLFLVLKGRIVVKELLFLFLPMSWVFYAFIGTPYAFSMEYHLSGLIQTGLIILLSSALTISVFSRPYLASQIVSVTSIVWSLINSVFFLAWISGNYSYRDIEFAGMFVNRNEFAINTVFLVGLALFFAKNRLTIYFTALVSAILLVASRSTTGFVTFVFMLFYPSFLQTVRWKKIFVLLLGGFVFGIGYFSLTLVQEKTDKVLELFLAPEKVSRGSVFLRTLFILEGLRIACENPFFGVGVNNSVFFLFDPNDPTGKGWYSHNNYVEMLLNAGFPGFILHYMPIVFVFFKVNKRHLFYREIKTFSLFYFLSGNSSVQYNFFPSVISYLLVIFLFLYYDNKSFTKINEVVVQKMPKNFVGTFVLNR